jgi:DNA replication and repair protein RecF
LALESVKVERFRCLDQVEFCPDASLNLIFGANGAGKTSVLEALFYLGRGRSFRSSQVSSLIQTDADSFTVFGKVRDDGKQYRLGVQVGRGSSDIHINGQAGGNTADLVEAFPVQIIDPEVHILVQGGPKGRRQFLDWGVFHVKHDFLAAWRRYRRGLQQRNMALRQGLERATIDIWSTELVEAGLKVDNLRRGYLEGFEVVFSRISEQLLGTPAICRYLPGWSLEETLSGALDQSWERDRKHGLTHVGPHRAELALEVEGRVARHRLSRGQQKLLGTALVLAQCEFVASSLQRTVALLVDEPAAELDSEHLEQLIDVLVKPGVQLFLTALEADALPLKPQPTVFHVKHGKLSTLL